MAFRRKPLESQHPDFPRHIQRQIPTVFLIMSQSIHISTARTMLNSGDPVDISVYKSDGSILELRNCISLRYNFCGGWRNIKLLSYGEYRIIAFELCLQKNPRLLHLPRKRLRGIPLKSRGLFVPLYRKNNFSLLMTINDKLRF